MERKLKKLFNTSIAILIVAGSFIIQSGCSKKTTMNIDTAAVTKGDISIAVTATGTVEPITLVEVGTQVSGVISKIYVDYNSVVKKREILAELDKKLLLSELETAQATLDSREVELEYQRRNYLRKKELWEKQSISQAEWEEAEYAFQTAEYAVTSSKANVFKAQTNLGYATIYSTIDGVVISRDVEEGQTVAASFSTPTLFTIANDLTKMRVIANVDEADIGGVEEGQRVSFTVDAYPDDEFQGEVVQVRLEATNTSNVITYEVVIDAPNPELKLKPGLTATANIFIMEERDVTVIPSKALHFSPNPEILKDMKDLTIEEPVQPGPDQRIVWVKNGQILSPKAITVGSTDGINTAVQGLNTGELVATGVSVKMPEENGSGDGETNPFMPQRPGGNRRR